MKGPPRLAAAWAALCLTACAASLGAPRPAPMIATGWTPATAELKRVGLGLPRGAALAPNVRFAGGIEIVADAASPLHSLSDLKLTGDGGFVTVSDGAIWCAGACGWTRPAGGSAWTALHSAA